MNETKDLKSLLVLISSVMKFVMYYTSVQKKCTPRFGVFKKSACFGLNLEFYENGVGANF